MAEDVFEPVGDEWTDGFRSGFVKGYEDGIKDGRYQGYKDAKHLALKAVKDDLDARSAVEHAVGEE